MAVASFTVSDLRQFAGNVSWSSLAMPAVVLIVLAMLVLPMPPIMLDIFFTFNILLALLIIMVGLNSSEPLDFSAFPPIILWSTMLRLGLNVASTRVVLLEGHQGGASAGKVIEAFGEVVVGGNYLVGFIVFAIIMIINFIVITKGAGRVSEVIARFTLDALPGKQMAIDADLNAGIIDQDTARIRRAQVSQESDFFGSMDGASKFVRGDAVAGLLILLINLIGGLTIGIIQYDLSFEDAARVYVLLAIGDGLVAQIPAIILSLGTAAIVTKVTTSQSMPDQAASQLANPTAFYIAGGILVFLGVLPGIPWIFTIIGLLALALGYFSKTYQAATPDPLVGPDTIDNREASPQGEDILELDWDDAGQVDVVSLELGYGLIPMVDADGGGRLLNRIKGIRKKLSSEMGFLLPAIRIRDNLDNPPDTYKIVINGSTRGTGHIQAGKELAINPGHVLTEIEGIPGKDPAFGLDAVWIDPADSEYAQASGYTVVDTATVMATHLNSVIKDNAEELMTYDVAQELINKIEESSPKLIEDFIPDKLALGTIVRVLQNLLKEGVPLRDMRTILETLAEECDKTQDAGELSSLVRPKLGRLILQELVEVDETLAVMTLEPSLEQLLSELVVRAESLDDIALEPNLAEGLFASIRENMQLMEQEETPPVLVVSPLLRPWLARLLRRSTRDLTVLSYTELPDDQSIRVSSSIEVNLNATEESETEDGTES